jgi:hypothetical protein
LASRNHPPRKLGKTSTVSTSTSVSFRIGNFTIICVTFGRRSLLVMMHRAPWQQIQQSTPAFKNSPSSIGGRLMRKKSSWLTCTKDVLASRNHPPRKLGTRSTVSAPTSVSFRSDNCSIIFYDYRVVYRQREARSAEEETAFRHDRLLHPRSNTDSRGNLVFDVHPAKLLLRQDVENGVHLTMDHIQLRRTRLQYEDVSPKTIYLGSTYVFPPYVENPIKF